MVDFGSMIGSIEKLNEYNYRDWRSCVKFCLKAHELWEVVDGSEISPPHLDDKKYNSWIVKASKAMHVLMSTIDKGIREQIQDVETPKEAWDTLASLLSNETTYALEEDVSKDEVWDSEVTNGVEDDVTEEEDWDLSSQNGELWIEVVESGDNLRISASAIFGELIDGHRDKEVLVKPGVKEWLIEAGVIKCNISKDEFSWHGVGKQGKPHEKMDKRKKIVGHSKVRQNHSPQLNILKCLSKKKPPDQVTHAKFGIGANLTRPPDREYQLGIKGEY